MEHLLERLAVIWADASHFTPRLLGAAAFILIGIVAAWVLERMVRSLCERLRLDESSGGRRLIQLGSLVGLGTTTSMVMRRLVRWAVIIVAIAQAASFWNSRQCPLLWTGRSG